VGGAGSIETGPISGKFVVFEVGVPQLKVGAPEGTLTKNSKTENPVVVVACGLTLKLIVFPTLENEA